MTHAETMLKRHQEVQAFLEEKYPTYQVIDIDERAMTTYDRGHLTSAEVVFETLMRSADPAQPSLRAVVQLLDDDSLRVKETTWYHGA